LIKEEEPSAISAASAREKNTILIKQSDVLGVNNVKERGLEERIELQPVFISRCVLDG